MKRKIGLFWVLVFCAGFVAAFAADVPTTYRVNMRNFKLSSTNRDSLRYEGNVDVSLPEEGNCHLWLYGFSRKGARVYVRRIAKEPIMVHKRQWYYIGECDSGGVLPISLDIRGGNIERLGLAITTTKEVPKNIEKAPELKVTR